MQSLAQTRRREVMNAAIACLAASWLAAAATEASPMTTVQHARCDSLTAAGLFKDTRIISATSIPADAIKGIPAYCQVVGVITAVLGSSVGVVYRLPETWNAKVLGLGGGGWAGSVRLDAAVPGLTASYATAQTDAGHEGTGPWETTWVASPEAVTDFSYRAIHVMTSVGKLVVAKYYGHRQSLAYFQGCSTGGRQGLMEVQRFPDDYNGVIAGAPVHTLLTQTTALLRNHAFAAPGAGLTPTQITRLNDAALASCDAKDGVKDGIVTDPRACAFDPGELQCRTDAPMADCLSSAQIAAVRAVYNGVKTADGRIASHPLSRGSEAGWSRFVQVAQPTDSKSGNDASRAGLAGMRTLLFGNPEFDLASFNADRDLGTVRGSDFAKIYEASNPDIAVFIERGGKLILWHGFDDPGPSPLGTVEYYEAVLQATGPKVKKLESKLRFFLAPGVQHCGGGPGAGQIDTLTALDQWVTQGKVPDTIPATRADGRLSRPLCAYPALPRYKGSGDPSDAANFVCRAD
jgi:feruloyl esterase